MIEKIKNIGDKILWTIIAIMLFSDKILWTIVAIMLFMGIVVLISLPGMAIGIAVATIITTFY